MSIQNERFTVIFNTRGSNVLSIGVPDEPAANVELTPAVIESNNNYNTVTYNVNWLSILPTKYKKFQCQFVFKSNKFGHGQNNIAKHIIGFIDMNIGRTNIYDGLQMSNNIGYILPRATTASELNDLYYSSTTNDNNDFWIDYPTNNQITITLNKLDGKEKIEKMTQYHLYLTMTGILDNEIDKSN